MACAPVPTPARRARRRITATLCAAAALAALPAAPALAAEGDLDDAFNGNGYAVAQPGPDAGMVAEAVLTQPDGKVVVAGSADAIGGPRQFGFARFLPNGALDPAFGEGGLVKLGTPGQGGPAGVQDLALDAQGRIVAVGVMYKPAAALTVVRLEPDGDHDTTFNAGSAQDPGWYYLHDPQGNASATANAVVIQPDGKIVVAGSGMGGALLARLQPTGAPDTGLGPNGFRGPHQINGLTTASVDVALQQDGRIVVGATAFENDGGQTGPRSAGVLRFETDGDLDNTFSDDGMTSARPADAVVFPAGVAIQGDGILVAGTKVTQTPPSERMVVARFARGDGALDEAFGSDGWAEAPVDDSEANALLVHAGKVYVGGHTDVVAGATTRRAMSLARLTSAGAVDATFGDGGVSTWLVGTGNSSIRDLAAYDARRVIAGGEARNGSLGDYGAALFVTGPAGDDDEDGEQPEQPEQPGHDQGTPPVHGGTGSTPPPTRPQAPTATEILAAAQRAALEQLDAVFLAVRNGLLKALAEKRSALIKAQTEVPGKQVIRFVKPTAGTRAVAAAKKKSKKKRGKRAKKPKVLAKGKHTFTTPGTADVRVKLTRAGRKAIRRGKRVRIVVESAFTPVGGTKQVERRTLSTKVPGKKKKKRKP